MAACCFVCNLYIIIIIYSIAKMYSRIIIYITQTYIYSSSKYIFSTVLSKFTYTINGEDKSRETPNFSTWSTTCELGNYLLNAYEYLNPRWWLYHLVLKHRLGDNFNEIQIVRNRPWMCFQKRRKALPCLGYWL